MSANLSHDICLINRYKEKQFFTFFVSGVLISALGLRAWSHVLDLSVYRSPIYDLFHLFINYYIFLRLPTRLKIA